MLGDVNLVTSVFFDIGVYLVVVGVVLDVLRSLGAELDRQDDEGDPIDAEPGRGDRPMTPTVVLPVIIGGLFAAGVYLLLERSLTRVLVGFLLLGNGMNLLLLSTGGPAGLAPIVGYAEPEEMSDPLPQALVLTAIVITLGVTAFLLAMTYRSWPLTRNEAVGTTRRTGGSPAGTDTDADELDPDDLAPDDRPAGHADSRPAPAARRRPRIPTHRAPRYWPKTSTCRAWARRDELTS